MAEHFLCVEEFSFNQKGNDMDGTTVIRVVSGMLFVVVLAVLVWRRKRTA